MSCLNDDVIREIFSWLARINPPRRPQRIVVDEWDAKTIKGDLGWIVLTHVCKVWRRVGIEHSVLWGSIVGIFPSAFKIVLERAQGAALSLIYDASLPSSRNVTLSVLREQPGRIRSLHVSAPLDTLSFLGGQEYPQLETLTLFFPFSSACTTLAHDWSPILAPVLTRLTLHGCIIPITSPLLKSLNVTGFAARGLAVSTKFVLDILDRCPLLVNLSFEDVLQRHASAPTENHKVQLVHLTHVRISTYSAQFVAFWDRITVPTIERLYLVLRDTFPSRPNSHINSVFSSLQGLLAPCDSLQLKHYSLSNPSDLPGLIITRGPSIDSSRCIKVTRGDIGWIVLTHVCRAWRAAGLAQSPLWGSIVGLFPTAFDTVLARARSAPLSLRHSDVALPSAADPALRLFSRPARDRLVLLDVRATPAILIELGGKEYPQLRALSIRPRVRPPLARFVPGPPVVVPALERLSMVGYLVAFAAPRLRVLHLTGSTTYGSVITLVRALDMLEQCPLLEELALDDVFRRHERFAEEAAAVAGRAVHLNFLRHAVIAMFCAAFTMLWEHIAAPAVEQFALVLPYGSTLDTLTDVVGAIRPLLLRHDTLQLRQCVRSSSQDEHGLVLSSSFASTSITAHGADRRAVLGDLFKAAAAFLRDDQIKLLDMGDAPFAIYPLELYPATRSLMSFISVFGGLPYINLSEHPPFPHLRTLTQTFDDTYNGAGAAELKNAWDGLVEFLNERARSGSAVQTLRLVGRRGIRLAGCGVDEGESLEVDHITQVRMLVDELIDERV
ncbi:hypothetical protein K488DRAFT_85904 [Vararia minispora EC-137]|uniref:Uncharacterized protein n=1 Tax=Vararia minispora EC-137 TaxID=1314806 RepID=A0ACB8QL10_9AGAM|nr:hypothetical protein K488DRAFT_85904 [Vararia minispora EC-137]